MQTWVLNEDCVKSVLQRVNVVLQQCERMCFFNIQTCKTRVGSDRKEYSGVYFPDNLPAQTFLNVESAWKR